MDKIENFTLIKQNNLFIEKNNLKFIYLIKFF